MAGEFNRTVLPRLAGSYFNWEAEVEETPPVGLGGIVALVGTHDWGPVNSAEFYRSPDEFVGLAGGSKTSLAKRVMDAFRGEGRPGKGGASAVIVVRAATGAAAQAALVLLNTAAANAVTLRARFSGTFANALRATVQPGVAAGTNELLILLNGRVIARYVHDATELAALVDEINATDDYLTAELNVDGVALAAVASAAIAGGNDGGVLTGAEHAGAQALLNNSRFSVVTPVGLTDTAIRASYEAWNEEQNETGKRFRLVVGGAAGETLPTANARSRSFNNWNVVNLGVGTLHDDERGEDLSTADLTARVAGAIAARGERRDVIYTRFVGLSVPENAVLPSGVEQESAIDAGTTVFSRDTNAEAPVFIREGVTTYADDSVSPLDEQGNKLRPAYLKGVKAYASIKNVAIQQGIEMAVDEWATSGDVLGDLPNNERARGLIIGRFQEEYRTREENEIVNAGWTVTLDPMIPQSDDDDFAAFRHGFHPTRSLRIMLNTVRMG